MEIPEEFAHERCEHDADGIPRYQMSRNAAGKLLRQPIPEDMRMRLRVGLFMDQLNEALQNTNKILADEGSTLSQHGGENDPAALRRRWINTTNVFGTEMKLVQERAAKLTAAIKALFAV